jgi:hypothetical protein
LHHALPRHARVARRALCSARAAVHRIGLQIERVVNLTVAVIVEIVAGLGRRRERCNASELCFAGLALQQPSTARPHVRCHHARTAERCDVVEHAIAVIVAARVRTRLWAGKHGIGACAKHTVTARLRASDAFPDVESAVAAVVTRPHFTGSTRASLVDHAVAVLVRGGLSSGGTSFGCRCFELHALAGFPVLAGALSNTAQALARPALIGTLRAACLTVRITVLARLIDHAVAVVVDAVALFDARLGLAGASSPRGAAATLRSAVAHLARGLARRID